MSEEKQEVTNAQGKTPDFVRNDIIETLKTCYDPEIPVDIWELGLIYDVSVKEDFNVDVLMTLTSPFCPVAQSLPEEVAQKIQGVDGVIDVNLEMTFEPPWEMSMMSEAAKLTLGFM